MAKDSTLDESAVAQTADALKTVRTLRRGDGAGTAGLVLLRADSRLLRPHRHRRRGQDGAEVSVAGRLD